MSNQEKLKNYLLGKDDKAGYLKSELSNGKVIMLSGKWGSGKTHFWQKKVMTSLNDEQSKIPNHYVSLYGKTSIEDIKNEIFLKVFESVDSFESEEKTKNIVKKSVDIVSSLTKTISVFGMSLDLSKVTDDSFEKIDNLLKDEKLKRTEEYLNNGAIICIDDFERKSKDIDLNDLFGFITQLTINFKCKVVIILNDDVFEGEEKQIFSNVKEKTVSKYLKYEPSIKELLNLIIDDKKKYKVLDDYYKVILDTFLEVNILNARIYMQVLDNLLEWIEKDTTEKNNDVIEYLIMINLFFIIYHDLPVLRDSQLFLTPKRYSLFTKEDEVSKIVRSIISGNVENFSNKLKSSIRSSSSINPHEEYIKIVDDNKKVFESIYFLNKGNRFYKYKNHSFEKRIFNKINNFIETGILEN